MKKIISLILVISMIAAFGALTVSADEITTIDASTISEDGSKKELFGEKLYIEKKYFAVSYTIKGLPAAEGRADDNGCCGIQFNDDSDVSHGYVFVFYTPDAANNNSKFGDMVWFGPWWDQTPCGAANAQIRLDHDSVVGKDLTIVCYGTFENGTLKVKTTINGDAVKSWGADEFTIENSTGRVNFATKVTNLSATFKFTQSDSPLGADAFDVKEAPKTGSTVAIVAAIAVISLAGASVASKKH